MIKRRPTARVGKNCFQVEELAQTEAQVWWGRGRVWSVAGEGAESLASLLSVVWAAYRDSEK